MNSLSTFADSNIRFILSFTRYYYYRGLTEQLIPNSWPGHPLSGTYLVKYSIEEDW
jgi:hypothetical protein